MKGNGKLFVVKPLLVITMIILTYYTLEDMSLFSCFKTVLGRLTLLQGALHDVLGCDRLRGNPTVDRQDLPCQPQLFRSEKIFFGKIPTKPRPTLDPEVQATICNIFQS